MLQLAAVLTFKVDDFVKSFSPKTYPLARVHSLHTTDRHVTTHAMTRYTTRSCSTSKMVQRILERNSNVDIVERMTTELRRVGT